MNQQDIQLFQQYLENCDKKKILLLVHQDPDLDALGSALALGIQLQKIGYTVKCFVPARIPEESTFLPQLDLIDRQFPKKYHPDLIIALDCSHFERIREHNRLDLTVPLINIDHHFDNSRYGSLNIIWDISSVGELLTHIFTALNWEITKDIATCLYAAISFDTGQFAYSNVTSTTMKAVSTLLDTGIEHHKICEQMYETKPLSYYKVITQVLENLNYNNKTRVVYTTLPYMKDTPNHDVINFLRQLYLIN